MIRKKAQAHEALGDIDIAEKYYIDSISRNPLNPVSYVELSGMYMDNLRFKDAKTILDKAKEMKVQHQVLEMFSYELEEKLKIPK